MFHKYSYLFVYFEVLLVYQTVACFIVIAIAVYCGDAITQEFLVHCVQDDNWSNKISEISQIKGGWVRIWQVLELTVFCFVSLLALQCYSFLVQSIKNKLLKQHIHNLVNWCPLKDFSKVGSERQNITSIYIALFGRYQVQISGQRVATLTGFSFFLWPSSRYWSSTTDQPRTAPSSSLSVHYPLIILSVSIM